jgi:hypothetical protein
MDLIVIATQKLIKLQLHSISIHQTQQDNASVFTSSVATAAYLHSMTSHERLTLKLDRNSPIYAS